MSLRNIWSGGKFLQLRKIKLVLILLKFNQKDHLISTSKSRPLRVLNAGHKSNIKVIPQIFLLQLWMIGRIKNCMLAIQISYVISNDSWLISSLLDYKKSKKWKWKKWFKSKQEYKNDDELREDFDRNKLWYHFRVP